MAGYTYVSNAVRELGLSLAVADMNEQPNNGNPPNKDAWTNQDLLNLLLDEILDNQAKRFQTDILRQALSAYPSISIDKRLQILTKLGLASLAPVSVQDQMPLLTNLAMERFLALNHADQESVLTNLGVV